MDSTVQQHFDSILSRHKLAPALVAVALSACATETVLLNSERIEQKFGSYGIDVLASEAGLRRSSLYSGNGDDRICRTYALVRFRPERDASIEPQHATVLAGNSLGEVFKASGWGIHKQTLHIGEMRLAAADNEIARLMQLDRSATVALHIYQLVLERDQQIFEYATIAEAHHPDYLSESDLLSIYAYDSKLTIDQVDLVELQRLMQRPRL